MRKTKIVCTMGPSTDKPGILRQLMENGMNVARFNFSHGDYEEHKGRFDKVRALSKELDLPIACMLDTKGPEIRLGEFKNGVEKLVTGQKFTLTSRNVEGTNEICSVTYKDLPRDVKAGGRIMLDDGLIELRIDEVGDTDINCTVCNDGTIKTKKGVNVPGVHLTMPYMSQRDTSDILFGIEQGFDLISASFARNAQDIMEIYIRIQSYLQMDMCITIVIQSSYMRKKIQRQHIRKLMEEITIRCGRIKVITILPTGQRQQIQLVLKLPEHRVTQLL